jgi:hypothetical protein
MVTFLMKKDFVVVRSSVLDSASRPHTANITSKAHFENK